MTNVLKTMNKFESEAQVTAIIKGLDANGDGKVQLRELAGFLNSKPDKKTRPEEEEACRTPHPNPDLNPNPGPDPNPDPDPNP